MERKGQIDKEEYMSGEEAEEQNNRHDPWPSSGICFMWLSKKAVHTPNDSRPLHIP